MSLSKLKFAMILSLTLLFGTVAGILGILLWLFGPSLGLIGGLISVVVLSAFVVGLQWLIAPNLIKWFTRMREIPEEDLQLHWIHEIVEKYSEIAEIKKPKVYLVWDSTPNAFAFGRTKSSSHLAVHTGLLERLNKEEIEAVIAHEIGHIKHWDVAVITVASMLPLMVYYTIVFFGSFLGRDRDGRGNFLSIILVYLGAFIAQFLSSLIVMRLGRTRESFADAFSAVATNNPKALRTGLAKIAYGFPVQGQGKDYGGMRSFYFADPINSAKLARVRSDELAKEIETSEHKRSQEKRPSFGAQELDKVIQWEKDHQFMEWFSSHPLTYKRIQALTELETEIKAGKITLKDV
ncbi:MAG: zinc metalloprotease HtpX [Candidatus Diapherotrites archaeon]|nr:zinc metalloprotease HtpX [Candidatus Diapherotrites archaeon]